MAVLWALNAPDAHTTCTVSEARVCFFRMRVGMRAAIASLALLVALTGACEKKRRPRVAQRAVAEIDASTAAAGASVAPPPTADAPQIRLIDGGAEPRATLQYHLEAGRRDIIDVSMAISARHKLGEEESPELRLPAFRLTLQLAVTEVLEGSRVRSEYHITEASITDEEGVDPMILGTTRADLVKAIGMSGVAIVDARGNRRNTQLDIPDGVSDQMKQILAGVTTTLDQLSSPFPADPIGAGARWEHYQTVVQNGMQVRQTTVFELPMLQGDRGTLRAAIKQTAERQPAFMPGLPMGVEAELLSLTGSGEATVEFDLASQVPQRASIAITTDATFAIKAGGETQSMTQNANVQMTIQSVTP